jgi:hypothetical protein
MNLPDSLDRSILATHDPTPSTQQAPLSDGACWLAGEGRVPCGEGEAGLVRAVERAQAVIRHQPVDRLADRVRGPAGAGADLGHGAAVDLDGLLEALRQSRALHVFPYEGVDMGLCLGGEDIQDAHDGCHFT